MNYIFPIIHTAEIGLWIDALDSCLDFVDDRVQSLSDEEIKAWNEHIVADVAFYWTIKKFDDFMKMVFLIYCHTIQK